MQSHPISDTTKLLFPNQKPQSWDHFDGAELTLESLPEQAGPRVMDAAFDRFFAKNHSVENDQTNGNVAPDMKTDATDYLSRSIEELGSLAEVETPVALSRAAPIMSERAGNIDARRSNNWNDTELSFERSTQAVAASSKDSGPSDPQVRAESSISVARADKILIAPKEQPVLQPVNQGASLEKPKKYAHPDAAIPKPNKSLSISAMPMEQRPLPVSPTGLGKSRSSEIQVSPEPKTKGFMSTSTQKSAGVDQTAITQNVRAPTGNSAAIAGPVSSDSDQNPALASAGRGAVSRTAALAIRSPTSIPTNSGILGKPFQLVDQDILLKEAPEITGSPLPSERASLQSASPLHGNAASPYPANASIVRQIIDAGYTLTRSGGSVEIALSPEELGRVRMAVSPVESGGIVHISVERPETLELVQRNLDLLRRDLKDAGWANVSISLAEGSQQGFSDQQETRMSDSNPASAQGAPDQNTAPEAEYAIPTPPGDRSGLDLRV